MDPNYRKTFFFSDESTFMLNGQVNKHNCAYWATENPKILHQRGDKALGVTVWAAISEEKIIGPYFFSEPPPRGQLGPFFKPTTVNSDRYLDMLQNFFLPKFNAIPNSHRYHFMQDGAPPHFSLAVRRFLDQHFGARWIGRGCGHQSLSWPPRSPDLTPCDFYLWGHIKEKVYTRSPKNYYDLIQFISEAFEEIDSLTLKRVFDSIPSRYINCVQQNGSQQL